MTANVWRRSIVGLAIMLAPGFSVAQNKPPKAADFMYAELAKVPKKAAARTNPFESDAEAPIAGAKLYGQHCGVCHGENAEGGKKGPSLRVSEVQQATPGTLFWLLTNGVVRKGMPVWSKLPDAQRWQLVTYIKSLGTGS